MSSRGKGSGNHSKSRIPGHVDLSQYIDGDASEATETTLASSDVDEKDDTAKRLVWSDDEDASTTYKTFKQRESKRRKTSHAQTRKAKAALSNPPIVGRRSAGGTTTRKRPRREKEIPHRPESESDSEDIENALPDFIKKRRSQFDAARERHGHEGLKLPPLYNDVYFSDDDNHEELETRPTLGLEPVREYKDMELKHSAGIIPAPIAQRLRDYQVEGAEFLHELFVYQKGGILGDDMGLGKTIQVIAFLTAAFGKTADARDAKRMRKMRRMGDGRWYPKALIICPGSLMENWKNELNKWGWWSVGQYHGPSKDMVLDTARHGRFEIVITTYTTYRTNTSQINLVDWDVCIADECHILKERKAEITKQMDQVNALCRIGLTGTAIQNRYEELWTLLNWTNPGRFGPISMWRSTICEPLKQGQSHDATVAQLAHARKTAEKLVRNLLPQFFLRRMKTLIADQLPKKTDRVIFCPLTQAQKDAYEHLAGSERVDAIRTATDLCDCQSGKKKGWCCNGSMNWQFWVFPMLMSFQKLCNHLALLIPSSAENKEKENRELEVLELAVPDGWQQLYNSRDSIMNFANQNYCGKWVVLKKLLAFWYANPSQSGTPNKVLVFSHSVRLLKMLYMLFQATTSYNVSYLDGEMPYEARQQAVDGFNAQEGQFVFLISTKAGGVGLNITSANKVIIFDPNWNPSYDLQAQDRAYRIGQIRDVEVFRLVSAGTLEEIVYARQIYKQQQANIAYSASKERRYFKGVQGTSDKRGEIFGLANIFAFQDDGVKLRDIVNKTNVAESRAGIQVAELDAEHADADDDADDWPGAERETEAMARLAATIVGEEPKAAKKGRDASKVVPQKSDAVAAILSSAGVQYTHENSEVIGSSKVETSLSRRAEASTGRELGQAHVFERGRERAEGRGGDARADEEEEEGDGTVATRRFGPAEDVRMRQFVSMARTSGYEDATDFALVVEGWTQEQRRDFLDRFYMERKRVLASM